MLWLTTKRKTDCLQPLSRNRNQQSLLHKIQQPLILPIQSNSRANASLKSWTFIAIQDKILNMEIAMSILRRPKKAILINYFLNMAPGRTWRRINLRLWPLFRIKIAFVLIRCTIKAHASRNHWRFSPRRNVPRRIFAIFPLTSIVNFRRVMVLLLQSCPGAAGGVWWRPFVLLWHHV